MDKLIISRKEWLRSEPHDSYLHRRADGKKCCLGIYLTQNCGIDPEKLYDLREPWKIAEKGIDVPEWMVYEQIIPEWMIETRNKEVINDLIYINDGTSIEDEKREEKITKKFAEVGIEVEFVE